VTDVTIDAWLEAARADARRRGLPELEPLLATLAQATRVLRAADFNESAADLPSRLPDGTPPPAPR
jgi:hypothetical protein